MEKNELIQRTELVNEAIAKLKYFSQLYGIDSIFVVGGYCRSLFFNRPGDINDIDVASAYEDQSMELAGLFASEVVKSAPTFYHRSGAAMINYSTDQGSIKIEFQGKSPNPYMHNQEIRNWLHNQDVDDEPLMNNIYGRDFTINALVYSLYDGNVYDPTQHAVKDLERGRIVSLLPPPILIKYNPLAALRAIRFSMKYEFRIDPDLQDAMRESFLYLVQTLSKERITKEVVRILKINGPDALKQLKRFDLHRLILDPNLREKLQEGINNA